MKHLFVLICFMFVLICIPFTLANDVQDQSDQSLMDTPIADDVDYQEEYMGKISGVVKECDENGWPIENVEIYIAETNELIATTSNNGYFSAIIPGGIKDIEFRHQDFWTVLLEDYPVPYAGSAEADVQMDIYMTYPDGITSPNILEMTYDGVATTRGFTIENIGCGPMEYDAYTIYLDENSTDIETASTLLDDFGEFYREIDNLDELTLTNDNASIAVIGNILYVTNRVSTSIAAINKITEDVIFLQIPEEMFGENDPGFVCMTNDDSEYLYAANDNGEIFKFQPDFTEIELVTDFDNNVKRICCNWNDNWIHVVGDDNQSYIISIDSGEISEIPAQGINNIVGLCYNPQEIDGYVIYAHILGLPSTIMRLNPYEMIWEDTPYDTVYAIDCGGLPGDMTSSISNYRIQFTTLLNNSDVDKVHLWNGESFLDWFEVSPSTGVINPGEEIECEIRIDFSNSDYFPRSDEDELFVAFSGPHMDDFGLFIIVHWTTGNPQNEQNSFDTKCRLQNHPNPFNPTTTISFNLEDRQDVRLTVFNLMGQEVARLVDGELNTGQHFFDFDGSHLASGIYFYRIETPAFTDMKKMVIMK